MSLEDNTDNAEIELRDLVTETLEDNGVLAKIRAQLRAGLYLALENDINTGNQTYNEALKSKLRNPDIRIIFCLVKEFLEYFELNFTSNIFDKETFMGSAYNYENREKLIQELDIGIDTLHNAPLLIEILNIARSSFNISVRDIKFNSTTNAEINKNNSTYDIIPDKLNSLSESVSEASQHVIGVKTVPKDENKSINKPNGNNSSDKEKTEIVHQSEMSKKDKFETDDTYEGTSSIAEDSVVSSKEQNLIDLDKSVRLSPKNMDQIDESKSPRLSFSPDQEKRKHDKNEKLKPMSGLTSLSDLPPLNLNKSRNADTILLPSLYSKDFREKSSLKELDKLLDLDSLDNYEEDFMSSGSVDNEEADMNNILKNIKLKKENSDKTVNKLKEISNGNETGGSSISEEFDINSNVDDLLKSSNT